MIKKRYVGLCLLAILVALPPPGMGGAAGAVDSPPEEYSRSGGGGLTVRLAPTAPISRPAVPKTLR
ncbi:MAG: hypothetical protein LIP23_01900, partial [Planctomycetes bacterium]|nr:hypothetical protein [Planctomycetota bacterium]